MDVSTDELVGKLTEEQQEMFNGLTKLQKGLSLNIIAGMKPAEAHRAAGGKCKNEKSRKDLAAQIIANPSVRAFIDSVMKPIEEKAISSAILSRQQALERLTKIATTETVDLTEGDTKPTVAQHHQTANMNMTAIKQISEMMGYNRQADDETGKLTQEERVLNMVSDNAVTDDKLD